MVTRVAGVFVRKICYDLIFPPVGEIIVERVFVGTGPGDTEPSAWAQKW